MHLEHERGERPRKARKTIFSSRLSRLFLSLAFQIIPHAAFQYEPLTHTLRDLVQFDLMDKLHSVRNRRSLTPAKAGLESAVYAQERKFTHTANRTLVIWSLVIWSVDNEPNR